MNLYENAKLRRRNTSIEKRHREPKFIKTEERDGTLTNIKTKTREQAK